MNFNLIKIRKQFPILSHKVNKHNFIYFDNAATVHKPISVISSLNQFYTKYYSSVHRGTHTLSTKATNIMEKIRHQVAVFINAQRTEEIIFTKSTTEGINLIANTWGINNIFSGDNIIISVMEHHSNIIPWQIISKKIGFHIHVIPLTKYGELNYKRIYNLIDNKTKLISITYISNVLGIINPIKKIVKLAQSKNILTVIDGAQAVTNKIVNVRNIGCDFFVFSGHKIFGPTGIGILYGKKSILELIPPWEGGGGMISNIDCNNFPIWEKIPWKFEAGSPNIAGIIGLGAALSWFTSFNIKDIINHNQNLMLYALKKMSNIPNIKIFGNSSLNNRVGIISFNLKNCHPYDIGCFLDEYGIAIRTGHHCAIPLMKYYNVKSMCRISFSIYNNFEEIDVFVSKLIYINNLLNK
ncbi:SufS family cysteine desulfurase [Enterobacteriaceae endosymbiont of Plateumaris consimilis]|uniref:SufS family cysteine desulfurase n=1 Tax=Enterobacteriaceae endosymbiont of Plateumaris consimilis TaxID=2675794 RepID=UPI00144A0A2A|nr:SufS family cysteine desulfurase [Enterobacteriaceae endosymbiont of Plateumaris consimilis]QJC28755.1 SufS family cysteine desulfurase [Enterobacteriaceae endosymbiont of Plateumaris consimilis]